MLSRPAWLPLVFLFAAIGCDSTETGGSGTQTGAAAIKITSPASGACVDVPIDRTVYVPVTIETTGLTLQPPGVCQAAVSCGNVVLFVDGVRNNAGAAAVIDLISTPEKPLGTVALKASVIGDDGVELVSTDGKAVTAELTFVAKVACDGNTGGTGGATGGTGGATGGTGGATGGTGGATGGTGGATGGTGGATGGTGGATGGTGGATGGTGGATGGTGGATGGTGGTGGV